MKSKIIFTAAIAIFVCSCYKGYVDDYEVTNMGFALSKPLRTVVHDTPIYVGVSIGGKRSVDTKDWATYRIDADMLAGTGFTLLPSNYYKLADESTFRVRSSNMPVADVEISFTDAFYADPNCLDNYYALPLRVTGTSCDEIREDADTSIVVIRYVSSYSGTYYLMGEVSELDASGNSVATETYAVKELSDNITRSFITVSPYEVIRPGIGNLDDSATERLRIILPSQISSGSVAVTVEGVTGGVAITDASGIYTPRGSYSLIGSDDPAPEFDLEYTYELAGVKYRVSEKLVLRRHPIDDLRVETW